MKKLKFVEKLSGLYCSATILPEGYTISLSCIGLSHHSSRLVVVWAGMWGRALERLRGLYNGDMYYIGKTGLSHGICVSVVGKAS